MNIFNTFVTVTNRGASNTRAEIIPSEPDPDNAGVGKELLRPNRLSSIDF